MQRLENVVRDWRKQYHQVGQALAEIRRRCLYYGVTRSWEEYLSSRWQLSYDTFQRLRDAAAIADIVADADLPIPPNATIAVTMADLEPEKVVTVWAEYQKRVANGSRAGASLVAAVKKSVLGNIAGVGPDGSLDADLQALLSSLPEDERAIILRESERRATAAGATADKPEWAEVVAKIRAGLKKLEHDEGHQRQYVEVLALLRRVVTLLGKV